MTLPTIDLDRIPSDALLVTQIVDASSGQPRPVRSARTEAPHAYAHVATGSYLVLSGRPELALPGLATSNQALASHLEFDDRAPLEISFTIPAGTVLPFRPADITVELAPATLQGTITQAAFPHAPIGGAQIAIESPAASPALLALRTPLSLQHPAGATVQARTLAPAAAASTLTSPASQQDQTVTLSSVAGCATGAVLVLGDEPTAEQAGIATVDAATKRVTLTAPLRRSRPQGAPGRAFTLTGAGPATTLARDAQAGDGVLTLTAAIAGDVVELGGLVSELRGTGARTDAAGRWRLDGVRAIGRLTVTASAAGFITNGPLAYDVDYRRPNLIDLRLTV